MAHTYVMLLSNYKYNDKKDLLSIGVGRFRILGGGQGLDFFLGGGAREAKFPSGT